VGVRQWLAENAKIAKCVWKGYNADRIPLAAAGVAFFLTLSVVPLVLLLVSIASFFVSPEQVTAFANNATATLGAGIGGALRMQLLSVVENRGALTGISLAFGLWTGSQVFGIMEVALNQVWGVKEERSYWVRQGLALGMVLVTGVLALAAVLLTLLIRVLGTLTIPVLSSVVKRLPWIITFLFNAIIPFLLITVAFLLIYRFLPARLVTWKQVLPGAVIAGILWTLLLQVFSWYAGNIANYNVLYGSLGGLVILMLWFNYSALVLLLGAELSQSLVRDDAD